MSRIKRHKREEEGVCPGTSRAGRTAQRKCTPNQVMRRERYQGDKSLQALSGRFEYGFYAVGDKEWHFLSGILGRCNLAMMHRTN